MTKFYLEDRVYYEKNTDHGANSQEYKFTDERYCLTLKTNGEALMERLFRFEDTDMDHGCNPYQVRSKFYGNYEIYKENDRAKFSIINFSKYKSEKEFFDTSDPIFTEEECEYSCYFIDDKINHINTSFLPINTREVLSIRNQSIIENMSASIQDDDDYSERLVELQKYEFNCFREFIEKNSDFDFSEALKHIYRKKEYTYTLYTPLLFLKEYYEKKGNLEFE